MGRDDYDSDEGDLWDGICEDAAHEYAHVRVRPSNLSSLRADWTRCTKPTRREPPRNLRGSFCNSRRAPQRAKGSHAHAY